VCVWGFFEIPARKNIIYPYFLIELHNSK
jgi:hypothetical protein